MTQVITFSGCAPIPLAGYLKALGVFRLIAEQADESVRGYWQNERFVLTTSLDRDEILELFLTLYRPTPILTPWNGGSGFYYQERKLNEKDLETGKKIKTGVRDQPTQATKTLDCIINSKADRFAFYRAMATTCKGVVRSLGFDAAPKEEEKYCLLTRLRSIWPDEALVVLDAALILGADKPGYAPLLGTGWNDGNLDFSNNFMQRLIEVIDPDTGEALAGERERLSGALFGDPVAELASSAIGQFAPGNAGGPNASTGFDAASLINPWDFILMLEGAVLFAASTTRRLESMDEGQLSYPFTVRPTGSGSGNAATSDEGNARAEIWLPLWEKPFSHTELSVLLSEGRATVGRRPARDGLDFARSVARLGVSRGINAFQRYAFLMRSGKAYLATPLNRIAVKRNPDADLIDQLERYYFLARFRRFARSGSARAQQLVRCLEDALFELASGAEHSGETERPRRIQNVLQVLGDVILYLADSPKAREECRRLPALGREWIWHADDKSDEFRIAATLAGLGAHTALPMLAHLVPVNPEEPSKFDEQSPLVTWTPGSLVENLAGVLHRRLLTVAKHADAEEPLNSAPAAPLGSISVFLQGNLDERRIVRLMAGMSLIRNMPEYLPGIPDSLPLPAAYCVLKPLFTTNEQLHRIGMLPEDVKLPLPAEIPRWLQTGKLEKAIELALRRLRIAGVETPVSGIGVAGLDGPRLLSALMLPIRDDDLKRVMKRIIRKDKQTAASET